MKDCPVCSIPMDEVSKSGVLIDVCPRCKGVWLDRGELSRLMEGVREYRDEYERHYEKQEKNYREHDRHRYSRDKEDYDKDYYKHGRKKKKGGLFGMLEDIFD